MKIVFTGGGTGGHFFPIIAIAQELNDLVEEGHYAEVELFYFSTEPYDEASLFEQHLQFVEIPSGKLRVNPSLGSMLKNVSDMFRVGWGTIVAVWELYKIFPDVVFGKGGYASFPTLLAARILGIPVIIHESDSVVTRTNTLVSKWAKKIAVSYADAAVSFDEKIRHKIAHTGQPIRRGIAHPIADGAMEYLKLESDIPVIMIVGGSQGAQLINNVVWEIVPELIQKYQIIHQVGAQNIDEMKQLVLSQLSDHPYKNRYKPFGFLNDLATSMTAGVADIVISRAGSQIFEIASWGIPSIIIPRTHSANNHNMLNAYIYAGTGACQVIEEKNLLPHILLSEIERILDNPEISESMKQSTQGFAQPNAGKIIAQEILDMALEHES